MDQTTITLSGKQANFIIGESTFKIDDVCKIIKKGFRKFLLVGYYNYLNDEQISRLYEIWTE